MTGTGAKFCLEASGLGCVRDDRSLFEDLSFRLSSGQVLLLEGRNGSGKTSLLRLLCGMRQPDAGEIRWDGEDIFRLGPDYHTHIAYVGHKDGVKHDRDDKSDADSDEQDAGQEDQSYNGPGD